MLINKIFNLIPSNERKKIPLILILVVSSIIFELISLALIIPLMGFIFNIQSADQEYFFYLSKLDGFFGISDLGILVALLFLIGIIVKNIFLIFSVNYLYKMIFQTEKKISSKILYNYICSPYSFFIKNNTSSLLHNTTQETWKVSEILVGSFYLVAEIIVIFGILLILMIVNLKVTLFLIFILLSFAAIFLKIYRKKLTKLGDEKVRYETFRIKQLNEIFGGIKDILLKDNQNYVINNFKNNYDRVITPTVFLNILRVIPRIWVEISFIAGITIFLVYVLSNNINISSLLPQIIFFTVCMIRLLPSVSKILHSFQLISFASTTINLVTKETQLDNKKIKEKVDEEKNISSISFEKKIVFKNINFEYLNNQNILNNINFEIKKNTMVAITGKSGSGKSTLLNILLGLIDGYDGQIYIDDVELSKENGNIINWRKNLGYIPQSIFINDDSLRRNIAIGISDENINEQRIDNSIKLSKIDEFLKNLSKNKDTILGQGGVKLSGGQIQRIGIARALYSNPALLILDEPTSALNASIEKEIFQILKNLNKTIILVTHNKDNLEFCDNVFDLDKGSLNKIK